MPTRNRVASASDDFLFLPIANRQEKGHVMTEATARDFPDCTALRGLLGIPDDYFDHAMALAYRFHCAERHHDAEVMCRGLLAADPRNWWVSSLYAVTLLKLGRTAQARDQVESGLRYHPDHPKLVAMRDELLAITASARQERAR